MTIIAAEYRTLLDQVQRFSPAEQQAPGVNGEWAIKDLFNHLLLHRNSRLAFSFTLRYTTPVALDNFGAV